MVYKYIVILKILQFFFDLRLGHSNPYIYVNYLNNFMVFFFFFTELLRTLPPSLSPPPMTLGRLSPNFWSRGGETRLKHINYHILNINCSFRNHLHCVILHERRSLGRVQQVITLQFNRRRNGRTPTPTVCEQHKQRARAYFARREHGGASFALVASGSPLEDSADARSAPSTSRDDRSARSVCSGLRVLVGL